jgi:hypothetical protein
MSGGGHPPQMTMRAQVTISPAATRLPPLSLPLDLQRLPHPPAGAPAAAAGPPAAAGAAEVVAPARSRGTSNGEGSSGSPVVCMAEGTAAVLGVACLGSMVAADGALASTTCDALHRCTPSQHYWQGAGGRARANLRELRAASRRQGTEVRQVATDQASAPVQCGLGAVCGLGPHSVSPLRP